LGTTLGTSYLIFYLILFSLILYLINLKITIKVLKKEIFRYKKIIISYDHKEKNFLNDSLLKEQYNNLRKNINKLREDLVDTNFLTNDNIKNDLLLALENIDIYGEAIDD